MSGSPKELLLWDACTSGDLDLVKYLVNDEGVNVNWADPEMQRTAFYRACGMAGLISLNTCSKTQGLM